MARTNLGVTELTGRLLQRSKQLVFNDKRLGRFRAAENSRFVRGTLALFLFLLIYDGAIRKWVVPGSQQLVFMAKDLLLLGVTVLSLVIIGTRTMPSRIPTFVLLPAALYALWVLIETANPNLPNLQVGLWGAKCHLLYAALIVLVPHAFRNLDDVFRTLTKIYSWIVVPVCALALLQLTLRVSSFLNQQVHGGLESVSTFGEDHLVRVTGPFSYIWGMAIFSQISVLVGIALFLWRARTPTFLLGLGIALATLPATGSRSVVAVAAVGGTILLLAGLKGRVSGTRTTVLCVSVLAVLTLIGLSVQDPAWQSFSQRAEGSRGDEGRAISAFTNAFRHMEPAGLIGFGAGAANAGSVALVTGIPPFSWLPVGTGFEQESGRLVLELGILGWALSLLMRAAMLWWALDLLGQGASRTIRAVAMFVLPVMALAMLQGNGVFTPPLNTAFFWFSAALLGMAHFEHSIVRSSRDRTPRSAPASRTRTVVLAVTH